MKNVLLISNKVFHYRLKVYDYLFFKFKDKGYELSLLTNEIQHNSTNNPELKIYIEPFSILKYLRKLNYWILIM